MSTFDKVKKFAASRPRSGGGGSSRGVFHSFEAGDNPIRLVGEFIEVKTHFIAPVKSRGERGLCIPDAFEGDGKLPMVVNCPDWDIENEKPKANKTCPICALQKSYREAAKKPGVSQEDKERFEEMAGKCAARTALKWNIIDRKDPYIIEVSDKGEKKVLGYKVTTIGMEAWGDIRGIFTQCDFDISDVEKGIDINVVRSDAKKTSYSARAILDGMSIKQTPLSADEREMRLHNLKQLCGKQTDPVAIRDALHSDLLEDLLSLNVSSESDDVVSEPETPKKFESKKVETKKVETKKAEVESEDDDAPFDDEEKDEAEKPVVETAPEASEWQCFGSIDPEHPECKSCSDMEECAKKAGVVLKKKK